MRRRPDLNYRNKTTTTRRSMRFWTAVVVAACLLPARTAGVGLRRELSDGERNDRDNNSNNQNSQEKWQWNKQNNNNREGEGGDGDNQWKNSNNDNDNSKQWNGNDNDANKWTASSNGQWNKNNNNSNQWQGKVDKDEWNAQSQSGNNNEEEVQLDSTEETEAVDAFLHSDETEWHEIPYDDDTVKGWMEMEAATEATKTDAPTPAWKSDEPSALPTRVVTLKPTWRPKTDSPTPELVKTDKPTGKPTRSPSARQGYLNQGNNGNGWNNDQNYNGFSINLGQPQIPYIHTGGGPIPTASPTLAPVTTQGGAQFFSFLSTPTFTEQGTSTAATSPPAGTPAPQQVTTQAPQFGVWTTQSPVTTTASTDTSNSFFQTTSTSTVSVATAPPATYVPGYTAQGTSMTDPYSQRQPGYVDATASYPSDSSSTTYSTGGGPGDITDVTHLFDASGHHKDDKDHKHDSDDKDDKPEPEPYPYPYYETATDYNVSDAEMQNMTTEEALNGTDGDYGFGAEGGEDYYADPYYPTEGDQNMTGSGYYYPEEPSSGDPIPSWDPYPSEGVTGSASYAHGKGGKGGKRSKGSKGGKGGGSHAGSTSAYEEAMKCIEDQKAAKESGKYDEKMKKCPDIATSKGGARKKIKMPKPGYPQPTYYHPVYPQYPSPSFFSPTSHPPILQAPVSTMPPIIMAPSVAPAPTQSIDTPVPLSPISSASPGMTGSPIAANPSPSAGSTPPSVSTIFPSTGPLPTIATTSPGLTELPTLLPNPIVIPSSEPPTIAAPTAATDAPSPFSGTSSPVVPTATGGGEITSAPSALDNSTLDTARPSALLATPPPSQPASIQQVSEVWVNAEAVAVEATGSIDLSTAQEEVFNQTVSVMKPYFEDYFQDSLESFQLALTFLESKTEVVSVGDEEAAAVIKSYFVAEVSFLISSDDMEDLIGFDKEKATDVVDSFYHGESRDVLQKVLYGKGIELEKLKVVHEGIPSDDDSPGDDDTMTDDESESDGESTPTSPPTKDPEESSEEPAATETKSTNAALYAGVVSGGVILVAIGAVLYTTRRSDRNFFKDALESVSDSLYNDSIGGPPGGKVLPVLSPRATATAQTGRSSMASTESRSRIKPAAITLRKKKAAQQSSESVSTLGSTRFHTGHDGRSVPISEEKAADLANMENGPDLVASRVLTYHDADIQGLVTNYPEFDIYHQSNPYADTAWSVDGLTMEDENDSFVARPRRWQDESSETGISGLPDHHSSSNGSARS